VLGHGTVGEGLAHGQSAAHEPDDLLLAVLVKEKREKEKERW
jgi:hypothetical protein